MTWAVAKRSAIVDASERAAICASAACLVHCLVLPVVLVLLPSFSAALAVPESFHIWVLALAIPSALIALALGWRSHRKAAPIVGGVVGLGLLAVGAFAAGETRWELPITVVGSVTLVAAHLTNWRWRHRASSACVCCD